jgi:hypothetical protein
MQQLQSHLSVFRSLQILPANMLNFEMSHLCFRMCRSGWSNRATDRVTGLHKQLLLISDHGMKMRHAQLNHFRQPWITSAHYLPGGPPIYYGIQATCAGGQSVACMHPRYPPHSTPI